MNSLLLSELQNKSTVKRRSAAKKLRKIKSNQAESILLEAFKNEIKDRRTWETQYHMLMAIAENDFINALPLLYSLFDNDLEYMVNVALGHTITKFEIKLSKNLAILVKALDEDKQGICEGALRAIAIMHEKPNQILIEKIINYVSIPSRSSLRFWVAAGAAGWNYTFVKNFLNNLLLSNESEETKKAAEAALKNQYLKWNIL